MSGKPLESKIDNYLARTRVALRGLPEEEIDDILRELRSHTTELAAEHGGDIDSALESLGDPVDLARTYLAENQMIRAECSTSPLVILQGLRHAARSRLGRVTATALYAFGYINVLTLWSAASRSSSRPRKQDCGMCPVTFGRSNWSPAMEFLKAGESCWGGGWCRRFASQVGYSACSLTGSHGGGLVTIGNSIRRRDPECVSFATEHRASTGYGMFAG